MMTAKSCPSCLGAAVLLICMALAPTAHAEPALDQDMAPEERARLQRELHDYSDQAYPDQRRLRERREEMRQRLHQKLQQADEDQNGGISRAEAGRHLPRLQRHFDRIDSNGDGVISNDELRAARERRREIGQDAP